MIWYKRRYRSSLVEGFAQTNRAEIARQSAVHEEIASLFA
jgi:hypothetical protein